MVRSIIFEVAQAYNKPLSAIMNHSEKKYKVAHVRAMLIYLLNQYEYMPAKEISEQFMLSQQVTYYAIKNGKQKAKSMYGKALRQLIEKHYSHVTPFSKLDIDTKASVRRLQKRKATHP